MHTLMESGQLLGTVNVSDGVEDRIQVYANEAIQYPLTPRECEDVSVRVYLERQVEAPVIRGQTLGSVEVWLYGQRIHACTLHAERTIIKNTFSLHFDKLIRDWLRP